MLFYYVQIKDRHDPGINVREKATVASVNKAGGLVGILGVERPKRHLDWLIIDWNSTKIITV